MIERMFAAFLIVRGPQNHESRNHALTAEVANAIPPQVVEKPFTKSVKL
jgi:hypothetical protein